MMATPAHHERPSRSSSASLSSPPHTSPEPASPSAQFAAESSHSITVNPIEVDAAGKAIGPQPPRERKKPGRKPKIPAPDSAAGTDAPPKKPRAPRKPKDPNAPPGRPRKKKGEDVQALDLDGSAIAQMELRRVSGPPKQPTPVDSNYQNLPDQSNAQSPRQFAKDEAIHNAQPPPAQRSVRSFFEPPPPPPPHMIHNGPPPQGPPSQAPPSQAPPPPGPPPPSDNHPVRTSGQNYDPIRSNLVSTPNYPTSQGSPGQHHPQINRASASPSISSLVDPPNQALTSPSIAAQSFFNQQQFRYGRDEGHGSVPPSPTTNRLAPSALVETSVNSKPAPDKAATTPEEPGSKKSDGARTSLPGPSKKKLDNGSTATSSRATSPKPPKLKEAKDVYPTPPPLPGSGLMGPNDGTEFRAPTVVLNIPMTGETNKYVNFTRLAEEQYGWDALHPRLAAQRDRLARVAAAGAALERNSANRESGDEMSLDSEGEGEGSNVEMGGMSDGRAGTGTDGGAKKIPRKRKMKEDEYDKDDGFVDDTELLWEEQAAATNDGFFVYSGPLVPEGEKPTLDTRADGAPKRARGRGSRGGATRGTGRRAANSALEAVAGVGRGGTPLTGPGSRGGSTTRKPRVTKADRARMEQEKLEREKMGSLARMPSSYSPGAGMGGNANANANGVGMGVGVGGGMQMAAGMGGTPMVFH